MNKISPFGRNDRGVDRNDRALLSRMKCIVIPNEVRDLALSFVRFLKMKRLLNFSD
jgi:hypothetical protein